jgi:hypothetical protein
MSNEAATTAASAHAAADVVIAREPLLCASDLALLSSLDPEVAGDEHVRSDMLALLTEDETLEALARYAPVFTSLGVHAGPSIATVQRLRQLQRLRRRLDLAQGLVTRHLQATGAPSKDFVSDLHRLLAATPEQSPLRVAFSLFLEQWKSTFRGGRPTKGDDKSADKSPKSDDASNKNTPTK